MSEERYPARFDNKDIIDDFIYDDLSDAHFDYRGDKKHPFYRNNKLWEARWTYGSNTLFLRAADPEITDEDVNNLVKFFKETYGDCNDGFKKLAQEISVEGKDIIIKYFWEEL